MAHASAPYQLRGKIGNLIFRVRDGKQLVHQAPSAYKPAKGGPAHGLNRREFAGAAKLANAIYRRLKLGTEGPVFAPYPQNILTAKLKKGADIDQKLRKRHFHYADTFRFQDIARALRGLNLGHTEAPSQQVRMLPLGPVHNPTAIKVFGLSEAAATIGCHGNARLELRFQLTQTRVKELAFDQDKKQWLPIAEDQTTPRTPRAYKDGHFTQPSGWIPAELIPAEGLSIPIPAWEEGAKYLTAITIEWREVRTVGRKIVHHHNKAIVRIAALHANANAFAPQDSRSSSHCHQTVPPNLQDFQPISHWRKNPEARIAAALQKLQT